LSGGAIEVASPSGLNIRALSSNTDSISVGGAIGGDVNSLRNDLLGLRSYVSGTIGHDTTTIRNDIRNLRSQVSNLARAIEGFTGDDPNTINVAVKSTSQPRSLVSGSLRISNNPRSLGNNPLSSGVHIQADPANSGGVMLGGRSTVNNASTGFVLEPGDSIFLEISNTNQIFARSKNNLQQTINMIGS
jgi:hypothetical protein